MQRRPVLLLGLDPLSHSLAGPGWRLRHMARCLAVDGPVEVFTPPPFEWKKQACLEGWKWRAFSEANFPDLIRDAHAIVAPPGLLGFRAIFSALRHHCPLAFDCYIPGPVEAPWYFNALGKREGIEGLRRYEMALKRSLLVGDRILYAGKRQSKFWDGYLDTLGRSSIDLLLSVPFGFDERKRPQAGTWLGNTFPDIPESRPLIVWGGGVWDWLDTETLVEAMAQLSKSSKAPILLFPGTCHPNPCVPSMKALSRLRKKAEELGLLNRSIFVNDAWAQPDAREDYLSRAAVGVVLSVDPKEANASFRTRILDYLWAGLPVLCTEGDSLADEVEKRSWGRVVPMKDPKAVAKALNELLDDQVAKNCRKHLEEDREQWSWECAFRGLRSWLINPRLAFDRPGILQWSISNFFCRGID